MSHRLLRQSEWYYRIVLIHSFNRYESSGRRVLTALVFCLMFASAHVVLHDSEEANNDLIAQDECQVCRLNHVPLVSAPSLSLFVPLQVVAYVLTTKILKQHNTLRLLALGARAPPLS